MSRESPSPTGVRREVQKFSLLRRGSPAAEWRRRENAMGKAVVQRARSEW